VIVPTEESAGTAVIVLIVVMEEAGIVVRGDN
jgi:hypothetical protein